MADDHDERTHQSSVLREIAERIGDGTAPTLSREVWGALLREFSDRVSADSARRLRTELHRRHSDVDADTATQLRAQLEARRGDKKNDH
jgi:hypothetical protein